MQHDIASYLFRNGDCVLPGIGKLTVVTTPAETDFINAQIKAPVQTIIFSPEQKNTSIFNELSALSEHLKMMINANRSVKLPGIGTFSKEDNDNIHFTAEQINPELMSSVKVERVIHHDVKHTIHVGDSNIESEMKRTEKPPQQKTGTKQRWWVAALVAAIIGITVIIIHFSQNATIANSSLFQSRSSDPTYHTLK